MYLHNQSVLQYLIPSQRISSAEMPIQDWRIAIWTECAGLHVQDRSSLSGVTRAHVCELEYLVRVRLVAHFSIHEKHDRLKEAEIS